MPREHDLLAIGRPVGIVVDLVGTVGEVPRALNVREEVILVRNEDVAVERRGARILFDRQTRA